MENKKTIKVILLFTLIFLFLFQGQSLAARDENVILLMVNNISLDEIEEIDSEELAVGLLNLKTRKNSLESFYTSINVGRKVNSQSKINKDLKLEYLGDVLAGENPTVLGKNSEISPLLANKDGQVNYLYSPMGSRELINNSLGQALEKSNLVALEIEDQARLDIIKSIIDQHRTSRIYIIPKGEIEMGFLKIKPNLRNIVVVGNKSGLLTSRSTKREGLIALEDLAVDIKGQFNYRNEYNIGRELDVLEIKNSPAAIRSIYRNNLLMLFFATVFNGLIYASQILLGHKYLKGSGFKYVRQLFILSTNNIFLTLLLSPIYGYLNPFIYMACLLVLNYFMTSYMEKNRSALGYIVVASYFLVVLLTFINKEYIYNSYTGFNNLFYGARFYGFNNGMAAVLLATSIYLVDFIYRLRLKKPIRYLGMFLVLGLNSLTLSTRFGANTGSFITSIFAFAVIAYYYILEEKIDFKHILALTLAILLVLSFKIYLDRDKYVNSHAMEFFRRIRLNGFKELYHMASFKLKELVRLTITPPFPIVLIYQFLVVRKERENLTKMNKSLLVIGLLGFFINDTGNILLIYMINYLLLDILLIRSRTKV